MKNHHKEMELHSVRYSSIYEKLIPTDFLDAIRGIIDKSNTVYMFRRLNGGEPDTDLVTWVKSNAVANYDKISIVSLIEAENIIVAPGEPIYRIDLNETNRASFLQKYKISISGFKASNSITGLYDHYAQDPLAVDDKAYEKYDFLFCDNEKPLLVSHACFLDCTVFYHDEIKKDYSNRVELRFDYRFNMHDKISDANYSNFIRNIIDESNIVYMFRRLDHGESATALVTWVKSNALACYDLISLKSSTETINIFPEYDEPIYRMDLDATNKESFLQKYRIPITALYSSNIITGLYDFFMKDPLFTDDVTYDQYDFIFCDNEKVLLESFTHTFHFDIFYHE